MVEKKNTDYFLVIIITFACLLLIGVSIFFQNENQKFHGKAEKITKNVNNAQNNSASKQEQKMDEIEKENQKIEAIAVDEVIKENQATIKTEEDVINYVTKMQDTVLENENNQSFSNWKEKSKKMFITVTDFIFYGGTIGNYTFESLSDSAKAKVVDMAIRMDNTIESHFPSYKETIQTKTKNTYHKVSDWLSEKKVAYFDDVKTIVGEENYQKAGEKYQEIKDTVSEKAGKVFDKSKEIYQEGKEAVKEAGSHVKDKLSNWYQNLKEKNS